MANIEIPYKFHCRPYQIPAWDALKRGVKNVVCCWHRGAGKDLFALNFLVQKMLTSPPAIYLHCFPKYSQAKKAIWTSVHHNEDGTGMSYLDHIPEALVKHKDSSDMRIELVNKAVYYAMGIEGKNADRARGMNPSFVILSEYSRMDAEAWYTLKPRVLQNNGTVLFLSTPNGQNHFYHLFNYASQKGNNEYFSSFLTVEHTKAVSEHQINLLREEGQPEDFIQQEYYCSFTRGAEGSYYGKEIQRARDEDRICKINPLPNIPVDTAWDIGVGDSTAIFFVQRTKSNQVLVLHYYENNNEGLPHYIHYLDEWKAKHKIVYGMHFVPHDMKNKEFSTGNVRLQEARDLGYTMHVVNRSAVDEGIQAVRSLLPTCIFDQEQAKHGIKALDFYRKKFNETLKVYYDTPEHDQYSHGADAFRYLAMGIKQYGTKSSLSKEWIEERRRAYGGY